MKYLPLLISFLFPLAAQAQSATTLVPLRSVWKYLDNGSNQGTAWRAVLFNDSAWAQGPAELGYGDGDESTVVGYGGNASARYITTYFRKSFTITGAAAFTSANLRVRRDDGVVIYLNGSEVYRNTMPSGTITYTTLASGAVSDEVSLFAGTVSPALLVEGTNVLAVEIHQSAASSTDISFDMEFTATVPGNTPVANAQSVTATEDTPKVITLTGSDPNGDPLTYSIAAPPAKGVLSGTPPTLTYTPNPNATGADSFTFVVSDGTNVSTAATVSLTVTGVNDTPVADAQSLSVAEDSSLTLTVSGSDVESRYGMLADYTQQFYSGSLTGMTDGFSGATFNENTGTLLLIRNDSAGGGHSYEYTANGTLIRTITQNGFVDTEAIAWMYGDTYAIAEENNNQRISIVSIAPGATTLARTAPGNITWTTPVGSLLNLGIECLCYDAGRDLLYYTTEKPAGGTWRIYAMNPGTGVSTVLCDVNPTLITAGVATDLSDMAFDRATDTILLLSHESNKIIRVNRAGAVQEQRGFTTAFTQAEALALTTDRLRMFVGGEPRQFARYALPADTLTYNIVSPPSHGSLSGVPPSLTYTPVPNYNGPDSFTFRVDDGTVQSAPATVTLTVAPANDAPSGSAMTTNAEAMEPELIILPVSDPDGDELTIQTTAPSHGILTVEGTTVTYTAALYQGPDSFTYTASDGILTVGPFSVNISVLNSNDPPVAGNGSVTTDEDTPVNIVLTATDDENHPLTWTILTPPAHGSLSGTAPNLTFTPAANYHGADSFTFRVHDGVQNSNTATVSLTIAPANDSPVAAPQTLAVDEDTPLPVALVAVDADGDTLSYSLTLAPLHGTLSGTAPEFTYIPAPNWYGTDSFVFVATDGTAPSVSAIVVITVAPVSDAPLAGAQALTTAEDTPLPVTLAGADGDGDLLTFTVTTPPAHGTLSGIAPNLTFTPQPGWNGADSFAFTVSDGQTVSAAAVVSLTVTPVNDVPVAAAVSTETAEDTPVTINFTGTDADGDPLTIVLTTQPAQGTLSGTLPNLTYTPSENWNGSDNFTFTVSDGWSVSEPAVVTVRVSPVNDRPVAVAQSLIGTKNGVVPVTLSGTDADGDAITFSVTLQPAHGALTGTAPNLTYAPDLDWTGLDSFSFTVSDGTVSSVPFEVTIEINPVNSPPVAVGAELAGDEDAQVEIFLIAEDPDADTLTFTITTLPVHGTLSGTAPDLIYTPHANWNGSDSFAFSVSDGVETSAPALVTLEVAAVNDAPVAESAVIAGTEDAPLTLTVRGSDADGDSLTFAITAAPLHGTLSGTTSNLTYTPDANWNGTDAFTITASDGVATSAPASITINLAAVNDVPVAAPLAVRAEVSQPIAFELTASDPDGDALTWKVLTLPQGGVLTGTAPDLTYTPNLAFIGGDSFSFRVSDGSAASAPAVVTLTVDSSGPWQMVARTGKVAPGAGGAVFSALQTDFVSDAAGRASFRATAGSITGIWTVGNAGLTPAVLQGAPAPGVPGTVFDAVTTGPWAAGDGELLIFGKLLTGTGGVTTSNDYGFWLRDGDAHDLLARENDPVPGMPAAARFNTLSGVATLEAGGNYVYAATMRTNSSLGITTANDTGLWGTFGAPQRVLVRENDAAPGASGGVFDTLTSASLTSNGAGQFGFAGAMKVAGSITNANRYGLWLRDPLQFGLVARGGNAAPGTATGSVFAQPLDPALDGSFAFRATLSTGTGGVTQSNDTGVWSLDEGTVTLLAREGSQAPGIPAGGLFAGLTEGASVNADGELAFRATLTNGGGVKSSNNAGLWIRSRFSGGAVALAAREGNAAPGAGAGTFAGFDYPFIADDGREAFTASLTVNSAAGVTAANDRGLWLRSAAGPLVLVLREGVAFSLTPEDIRTVSAITLPATRTSGRTPLSADGRLLVLISFSDGTTALYHYAMP